MFCTIRKGTQIIEHQESQLKQRGMIALDFLIQGA